MKQFISLILGGGRGTRLYPLTKFRSKPAVPLAGKYRIIDIPISNCLNSGLNRMYVLTQFLSTSLHRHITNSYKFDHFSRGFVEILAAQQTTERQDWYQGTADAVRQNLRYLQERNIEFVLILSGDQLYRMNFRAMIDMHMLSGADVSIAVLPVSREAASSFGIMKLDDSGRVVEFVEKPKESSVLDRFHTPTEWIDSRNIKSAGRGHLASMGIYLFKRDVLVNLLTQFNHHDFGKDVFPHSIKSHHVQAFLFDGYWEDIGTIRSFWKANLDLTAENPPLILDSADDAIYTRPRYLPPARVSGATITHSLIADGCTIGRGCHIENSVIGVRCHIGSDVTIRNSVIMGADYYETAAEVSDNVGHGRPNLGIGSGSVVEGAIVDKNCRIGRNVRIVNVRGVENSEESPVATICDGIVVIPKEMTLPAGWTL
jgi:glucose-1-phosphate adenylyltransferase